MTEVYRSVVILTQIGQQKWAFPMKSWCGRAETECDGTRKRTGGEVKGKKANGGGSQQSCTVSDTVYPTLLPLMRTPRLPAADWTDTPADLNGLVRFAGKPNPVSARVPSRSVSALPTHVRTLYAEFRVAGETVGFRPHWYLCNSECNCWVPLLQLYLIQQ